jgi:ParB family chromosome partitioning protein
MAFKCPETIEELEKLERLLPLCRKALYEATQAKLESGAARTEREATRQLAEESGKPEESIRTAIKSQKHKLGLINPPCEKEKQAVEKAPICAIWTGDQDSYTPTKYIEAARQVMGGIDLDPASNEWAQKTVKAKVYYTKEDNGLDKPWQGNIFLNPPYSHPEVKHFVDKLLKELKLGQQAILLTNNNTDTKIFHDAAKKAAAVCFTKGRINFLKPDGSLSSPTNGQVFYYFGENNEKFIQIFLEFGILMATI